MRSNGSFAESGTRSASSPFRTTAILESVRMRRRMRSTIPMALLAVSILSACGGKIGVDDRGDASVTGGSRAVAGRTGASDSGGASVGGAGGNRGSGDSTSAGGFDLVACNDGTGNLDCCPPGIDGARCESGWGCSTGCDTTGWRSSLMCGQDGRLTGALSIVACDRLIACKDGTGTMDCCPERSTEGATCDGSFSRCSPGGCRGGFKSYLYCGSEGILSAALGLLRCGIDAGQSGSGD